MIVSNLKDSVRYIHLHPLIDCALKYIVAQDWSCTPLGRINIKGDELFINYSEVQALQKEEQILECHRKYMDIHFVLSGEETLGWLPTSELRHTHTPYNEERDCAFFTDKPSTYVKLRPGDACFVFPEDAHAPIIGRGIIRKLVVKIAL